MPNERAANLAGIGAFCRAHPTWVLFDEAAGELFEVATGKRLRLPVAGASEVLERTNAQTGRPYLLVELEDGREFALCDAGIAFAPVRPGGGPELPSVVCLKDFGTVRDRVAHQLFGHRDEKPGRETLDAVMLALGILEGARRVGFDISVEERDLELLLTELERRR
jgi:hypothetical protein